MKKIKRLSAGLQTAKLVKEYAARHEMTMEQMLDFMVLFFHDHYEPCEKENKKNKKAI